MLRTPRKQSNPSMARYLLSALFGVQVVDEGYIQMGHWNPEANWAIKNGYEPIEHLEEQMIPEFGVCDSITQFDAKYGSTLREMEGTFAVFFVHVEKDPGNVGRGGGWRWRKWGAYVGEGQPSREYLDDEPEGNFDEGVFTYHIYELEDQS